MIKRTQDPVQGIGGFATGMAEIRVAVPDLVDANHDANATPERDQKMAIALWGPRVTDAAEPLKRSAAARLDLGELIGLSPTKLHGDPELDAERIGRELFATDLPTLVQCVRRLAALVGPQQALSVFEAVATCTSYDGEPWVATVAAAELGAQVALLTQDAAIGRLLHLRSGVTDLPRIYVIRGDRRRAWGPPLDTQLYSHLDDPDAGLPVDFECELRIGMIQRFANFRSLESLKSPELDDAAKARWDDTRPKLLAHLRRNGVVGLLACQRLDRPFVDALVSRYPLIFVVSMDGDVAPEVVDHAGYQALEPGVDEELAEDALLEYSLMCGELGGGDT